MSWKTKLFVLCAEIIRTVLGASVTITAQQIACRSTIANRLLLLTFLEPTGSGLKYTSLTQLICNQIAFVILKSGGVTIK
jgi:hypothetical protein